MRDRWTHIIVVIAYLLLAVAMSWPLAANFASAIPGVEGDSTSYLWALGWAKTSLVDLHVDPFHTNYVYYPLGGATQLLWAVSLIGVLSIPLQLAFGLIVAHNLLYLGATVLTGYGMFLLAEYVLSPSRPALPNSKFDSSPLPPFQTSLLWQFITLRRRLAPNPPVLAPFVAGLVFAFAPLRLGYGLSFLNLFNTEFIPFFVLFFLRATRGSSWRDAILAGAFFGVNAYIDFQIAAFLALFALIVAAYVLASDWRLVVHQRESAMRDRDSAQHLEKDSRRAGMPAFRVAALARASLSRWAAAGLVAAAVAAPMLVALQQDFDSEGGNYIRVFPIKYSADRSYDLFSFFVPNARSTWYAGTPLKVASVNAAANVDDLTPLSPDSQFFAGYAVLTLALFAVIRRPRRARLWVLTAAGFALLSLGPSLHILGRDTGIPLPYLVLHQVPILNNIRIPMRYGIMVSFALAVLAAMAIDELRFTNYKRPVTRAVFRVAVALIPVLILLESAVLPYPVQSLSIPSVYADLARVPGDFTILEIPTFHWRGASALEWYQALDGKRILRAYTNRIAPGLAEYFGTRGIPIVDRSLRVLEGFQPDVLGDDDIAEDKSVLDRVLQFYDLRYAVLHRLYLTPDEVRGIDSYLRQVLGARKISDDGETMAYQFPAVTLPPDPLHIDLRENIGQMYAGRGWQFQYPPANWDARFNFVWAAGAESEIYFVGGGPANRAMTINAFADPPQHVRVTLNGEAIGEWDFTPEWKDYKVTLPGSAINTEMNVVRLDYGAALKETVGVTTIDIQ